MRIRAITAAASTTARKVALPQKINSAVSAVRVTAMAEIVVSEAHATATPQRK